MINQNTGNSDYLILDMNWTQTTFSVYMTWLVGMILNITR